MSFRRVMQRDWNVPNLEEWLENLETAVREAEAPMVIVAHSLSCSLVAHWLCLGSSERVAVAMLVSLADADSDAHMPPEARVFSPVPPDPLPFRAMVIASSTDPYVDIGRVRLFARCWGARLVEVGDQERINVDSGHGEWSAAKRYLAELLEEV
jgi:uncharacterized protein